MPKAPSDEGAVTAFAVTGGENKEWFRFSETGGNSATFSLPPSKIRDFCHLIHFGMIATGNHRDYRFAARSTTLLRGRLFAVCRAKRLFILSKIPPVEAEAFNQEGFPCVYSSAGLLAIIPIRSLQENPKQFCL